MKKKIILDTSLFVNPASGQSFGSSATGAFVQFLKMAGDCPHAEFFMPPSIFAELMYFTEENKIPKQLLLNVTIQPPKKNEIKVPGVFIYELVETMRDRIDRGLRLAERVVRETINTPSAVPAADKTRNAVRPDAAAIGALRDSYRRIMREGMLDSKADVDLLLLAYELEATLSSADQGVLDWANNLGIAILPYAQLHDFLEIKKD